MMARLLKLVPNTLSLARLTLGIGFPLFPAAWRVGVVVAAALTDLLDGAASRRWNASSLAGRLLDPLADKVFAFMVVGTLIIEGTLAPWEAALVSSRDLIVLAGVAWVLVRKDWPAFQHMRPTMLGKLATTAQFCFFFGLLIDPVDPELRMPIFQAIVVLNGLAAVDLGRAFLLSRNNLRIGLRPQEHASESFPAKSAEIPGTVTCAGQRGPPSK